MTLVSPLRALADAVRETARGAAEGVVQVRSCGARPTTATHLDAELVVGPQHALDRDEGLTVVRGDTARDAALAGRDESLDLALLRVPGLGASPLRLAEDADAAPADLVVAVARSWQGDLVGRLASVTGTSCLQRRWRSEPLPSLLRTDLAPARGVSGGVLVDADGHVCAWLTTGLSRGSVLGIPASLLSARVARLAEHGRIRRGYLGLGVQPVELPPAQQDHGTCGLLVSGIDAAGPGSTAGVLVGDVLLTADAAPLHDPGGLQAILTEARIGTALALRVLRGTTVHDMNITIGERER